MSEITITNFEKKGNILQKKKRSCLAVSCHFHKQTQTNPVLFAVFVIVAPLLTH